MPAPDVVDSGAMADSRDMVELGGEAKPSSRPARGKDAPSAGGQGYLRLWFRCSNQYARAYKTPDGTRYLGRCPKCGLLARFSVGPGGTSQRFFEMSCDQ